MDEIDRNKEHLKNLIVLAYADGVIEESELRILRHAAEELGISPDKLEKWVADADNILLQIPKEAAQRERQLIDMITIATADGFFNQDEYDLCKLIADKLHYDGLANALNRCMNKCNLKNLVALACADGKVDEAELAVLQDVAKAAGLTPGELNEWIARGSEFVHVIPENEEDRETQLIQMLSLAIADGEFSEDEYNLCKTVAERLGFSEDELKLIIRLSFNGSASYQASA